MVLRKGLKRMLAMAVCIAILLTSAIPAFAAVPAKDEVEYKGNGTVEVEFKGKVNWKNPTVTVKDSSGKVYTATIVKKDSEDITFRIKNYKEGVKYTYTVSGVKKAGTSGYGKVSGTITVPKSKITKAKAKTTAINSAVSKYKFTKSTIKKAKVELDSYRGKRVWEVSFEGKRSGQKGWFEFEYLVDVSTGKILKAKAEKD